MRVLFSILLFICIISACERAPDELVTISGMTMGTTYSIKLMLGKNISDKDRIHADIESILTDVNQSMSTYIPDSELSLLNQSGSNDWQLISDDLYGVMLHANHVSITTNGAFDVTVGPLVNIWGFGPDPYTQEIPQESLLHETKQHTGYKKIELDLLANRILKSDPAIYIDLSGIAKGFAVDKIALYLDKNNIQNYLVEIGGELIGKGVNANQQAWQIGIEQANVFERSVQRIVNLNNMAMATSGDYRNYFEKDGVRYSHTIDPITGKPINHNLASVTVLDKSTMHADAMATAFMVLGTEKTHRLANELGLAVYTLSKTQTGFEERYNDSFKPYLSSQ
ncbi:MAG: FAD:protein FMN transferase [Proteobacteria bacterium]|nr:FAD:protein FMN transferase [Pseudomonadota bacterium]NOG61149.1 FAD:protein FMN transferase [Pseudomonadota bacterium]